MSSSNSKPPNLYQLLGLKPLESDQGTIAAALKRLQDRLEPASGGSTLAENDRVRVARVLALGQKFLLDPNNKIQYDRQWIAAYQSAATAEQPTTTIAATTQANATQANATQGNNAKPASNSPGSAVNKQTASSLAVASQTTSSQTTSSQTTSSQAASAVTSTQKQVAASTSGQMLWDMSELERLLPAADPSAPFDMATYLSSSQIRDPLAAEADLMKLISILSQDDPDVAPVAATSPASVAAEDADSTSSLGLDIGHHPAAVRQGAARSGSRPGAAVMAPRTAPIGDRLRQKKQRSILIGGISLAAGVAGLVLLGLYLSRPTPQPDAISSTTNAASSGKAIEDRAVAPSDQLSPDQTPSAAEPAPEDAAKEKPRLGRRSGLPKPGENTLDLQMTPEPATTPIGSDPTMVPNSNTNPSPANPSPANPTPANPTATPNMSPSVSNPAGETSLATSTPAPAAVVSLSDAEKAAWKSGMTEARQALSKLDAAKADEKLKSLIAAIKNDQQRAQWNRLSEVTGFIKDIRQAMVEAISGLSGADQIKVGTSTVASFVEGDENKIVVRLAGTRRAFPLSEMPVAMGVALVDMKMDVAHANSLARKGAYIVLHPKNDAMLDRGKTMLAEAAKAGAISAEVARFYEEDFSIK